MRPDQASPISWMKSSRCHANNTCVEVARLTGHRIAVRDAGHAAGAFLVFGSAEWRLFAARARSGDFDR